MSIIETSTGALSREITINPETETRQVLNEYFYPRNKIKVQVVGSEDSRIWAAHEIEVAAMAELGDPEEEVRAEFAPYMASSLFFLAFDIDSAGTASEMKGMGRIIPSSEATGNKSLIDLSTIESWKTSSVPETLDEVTGQYLHETRDVVEAFKAESGCASLDKVWDLATLGFDVTLGEIARGKLADSIISAFTEEGICEWRRGRITHCTSFNQEDAHKYFVKLGYPYHEMFGLEPMLYDSFGTSVGMKAQPAWLSMEELVEKIEITKRSDRASRLHLGRLALGQCSPDSPTDKVL